MNKPITYCMLHDHIFCYTSKQRNPKIIRPLVSSNSVSIFMINIHIIVTFNLLPH